MAKIKSFSDLEQSKVLEKLLPLESADMHWTKDFDGSWFVDLAEYTSVKIPKYVGYTKEHLLPCWSLPALLNVLPNNENISTNLSKGGYRISTLEYTNSWFVDYEDETNGLNNCVTSADNPVDACVAMILKLNELNYNYDRI